LSFQPQQPPLLLPTSAIAPDLSLRATTEQWFDYPIKVHPHHTDYAGVVWHGTYITWMEAARVECLRSLGIEFADLVRLGCDLPVVEMSIRYHRALRLGESAIVRTYLHELTGVRLNWDYKIQSPDEKELYVTAKVALVAVDLEKGKIMRQLPPVVKEALAKLSA
jgi:acyl-CoA thioester hydrolase